MPVHAVALDTFGAFVRVRFDSSSLRFPIDQEMYDGTETETRWIGPGN